MDPWMDELTEDWVSQPRSSSPNPKAASFAKYSLPQPRGRKVVSGTVPSRIPRRRLEGEDDHADSILNERSFSEINIASGGDGGLQGGSTNRRVSFSKSVNSSSLMKSTNTVAHRSKSLSPRKDTGGETPEWKRRLLGEGSVAARDLFAPAATHLEDLFRPAVPHHKSQSRDSAEFSSIGQLPRLVEETSEGQPESGNGTQESSQVIHHEGISPVQLNMSQEAGRQNTAGRSSHLEPIPSSPPVANTSNIEVSQNGLSILEETVNETQDFLPDHQSTSPRESQTRTPSKPRHLKKVDSDMPAVMTPPAAPQTPTKILEARLQNDPSSKPSGSPLRLFGNYDTFTSNKVFGRLAQMEDSIDVSGSSVQDNENAESSEPRKMKLSARLARRMEKLKLQETKRKPSFGDGKLRNFQFRNSSILSQPEGETSAPDVLQRASSRTGLRSRLASGVSRRSISLETTRQRMASTGTQRVMSPAFSMDSDEPQLTEKTKDHTPPHSPPKGENIKRRRVSQILNGITPPEFEHLDRKRSTITGKRKDARGGEPGKYLDPESAAQRHILRPRSLRSASQTKNELDQENENEEASQETVDRAVEMAREVLHLANTGGPVKSKERKASVTTQDFYNEAFQIMAMLRQNGRPKTSPLPTLSEKPTEPDSSEDNMSGDDSTQEEFLRPPSREGRGGSLSGNPNRLPPDPTTEDYLRMYEDKSEVEDMTSSLRLGRARQSKESPAPEGNAFESDIPNIRISHGKRTLSAGSAESSFKTNPWSTDGPKSSNSVNVTNSSAGTNASSHSDNVRTIAPSQVAHLVQKSIAGMVYDSKTHRWVQNMPLPVLGPKDADDPFEGIPDLSVDDLGDLPETMEPSPELLPDLTSSQQTTVRREQHSSQMSQSSMSQSHSSTFSHSIKDTNSSLDSATLKPGREQNVFDVQDFAEELPVDDAPATPPERSGNLRHVSVGFSSPLVSVKQYVLDDSHSTGSRFTAVEEEEGEESGLETFLRGTSSPVKGEIQTVGEQMRDESVRLRKTRQLSTIPEIETVPETATPSGNRQLSMVLLTPPHAEHAEVLAISSERGKLNFDLVPLPDFSIHQADDSAALEVSIVGRHDERLTLRGVSDGVCAASEEVVRRLTDLEPYEPYWEDIREINLNNMALTSVHTLDEFCPRIERLDLTENSLSHLEGAPFSIRDLALAGNRLTAMTAWGHLTNLQYLDISSNEITSLNGLKPLVHLRELRVNNNSLTSLEGVLGLDGLIKLQVRRNALEVVDFSDCSLRRLVDLDLAGNKLTEIRGLDQLPSLEQLNLDKNELSELDEVLQGPLPKLQQLRVSGNRLRRVNVSNAPNLKVLYLDDNHLEQVQGLHLARGLDSLSARRQTVDGAATVPDLGNCSEVRKLYLSANTVPCFNPHRAFMNLHLLELANVGLEVLPPHFGTFVPNVRVVNLNFNGLRDLRPLQGIEQLRKLSVVGNRLARLRKAASVIAMFPTVVKVDLRDNPLTVGFYSPVTDKTVALRGESELSPFEACPADEGDDAVYIKRLDTDTKLRRRLYEMLLVNGCPRIKTIDGLSVDKERIVRRDEIWNRLVEIGVLRDCQPGQSTTDDQRGPGSG